MKERILEEERRSVQVCIYAWKRRKNTDASKKGTAGYI
jgi:hypothetical protein